MVLEYVFLIHLHESVQTHSFTVMESHSVPFIMHYNATICTKYKGCNSISISPTQNVFILLETKQNDCFDPLHAQIRFC